MKSWGFAYYVKYALHVSGGGGLASWGKGWWIATWMTIPKSKRLSP